MANSDLQPPRSRDELLEEVGRRAALRRRKRRVVSTVGVAAVALAVAIPLASGLPGGSRTEVSVGSHIATPFTEPLVSTTTPTSTADAPPSTLGPTSVPPTAGPSSTTPPTTVTPAGATSTIAPTTISPTTDSPPVVLATTTTTTTTTTAPVDYSAFVGTWHFHVDTLTVTEGGEATYNYKTGGCSGPCESSASMVLTQANSTTASGTVTTSSDPAQVPLGPVTLNIQAGDMMMPTFANGPTGILLCGPAVDPTTGNCGA